MSGVDNQATGLFAWAFASNADSSAPLSQYTAPVEIMGAKPPVDNTTFFVVVGIVGVIYILARRKAKK